MEKNLTNNEIDWLHDALKACTDEGRGWLYGDSAPEGGFDSPEDMANELLGVVGKTLTMTPGEHTRHFWTIHIPDPADQTSSLIIGHTGNGPRSEAHARLLAAAPGFLARLIDERQTMTKERDEVLALLREATANNSAAADTIDSMTASRTAADRTHYRWVKALERIDEAAQAGMSEAATKAFVRRELDMLRASTEGGA